MLQLHLRQNKNEMIEKLGYVISLCRQAAPSANELLLLPPPRDYSSKGSEEEEAVQAMRDSLLTLTPNRCHTCPSLPPPPPTLARPSAKNHTHTQNYNTYTRHTQRTTSKVDFPDI